MQVSEKASLTGQPLSFPTSRERLSIKPQSCFFCSLFSWLLSPGAGGWKSNAGSHLSLPIKTSHFINCIFNHNVFADSNGKLWPQSRTPLAPSLMLSGLRLGWTALDSAVTGSDLGGRAWGRGGY